MKGLTVFLLTVVTVSVTARHRKEWKRVDSVRMAREHIQPIDKYDVSACTRGAGFYRDPQDCRQYIRCVDEFGSGRHFSVFVGRCEPGLVFDENVSACNWPELAAPCSDSPEKLQVVRNPVRPETAVQENVIPEEASREKPYPVQQQVVHTPQESDSDNPQQEAWEIQVVHPQEGPYPDEQVTWQQVFQTTEKPHANEQQQQEIQQQEPHQPAYQDEIQEQEQTDEQHPQQQITQSPITQQQNFEQKTEFEELIEENNKSSDETQGQQQIKDAESAYDKEHNERNPNGQQDSSGVFEEIEENPQFEIPANAEQGQIQQVQETQSQWWIPENSAQHNPVVGEQIPASDVNEEPLFCEKEGFFRHPENCSQFVRCVKFESAYAVHFFECPKQLVFNEKDSACVVDDEVSCRRNTRRKRQAPSAQLECQDEGFFRHPQDCRAFYRCVKTESGSYETHLFSCPANLVFDEEYTTCNWPEKAPPCDNQEQQFQQKEKTDVTTRRPYNQVRTTSEVSTQKPRNDFLDKSITQETYNKRRSTVQPKTTSSYESSTKCRSQGFFSNKDDCRKFYKCVKRGNRYVRYDLGCPNNYAFDDRSKKCIAQRYVTSCSKNKQSYPPRQADEETTVIPETSSVPSSSNTPESSNEDIVCKQEGYFRHPDDCNKFYRCVDFEGNGQEFVRYDFNCPEGLIFDETNSVCNWPDPNTPCETRSGGGGSDKGDNEGTGDDSGNEGPGDDSGNEGPGDDSGNEGPGDDSGNEGPGDDSGNEGPGDSGNEGDGDTGNEGDGDSGNEGDGENGNEGTGEETSTEITSNTSSDGTSEEQGESGNEAGSNECTKEGFYRNPEDCNKFYRCVDFSGEGKEFVRYDFACPEGLVFDEANSVCNWPSDSEPCGTGTGNENGGGQEGPETSTSGTEAEDGNESGGEQGTDTTTGVTSSQGSPDDNSPESTTENSSVDGSPDEQIGSSQSPEATPDSNESGGNNRGECTEAGFFRNPENCNKFYRCVDYNGDGQEFVKYDFTCPEGLVFDETNSVCNWPEQSAPCEGGTPGESTPGGDGDGSDSSQTTDGGEVSQTTSSGGGSSQTTAGESDSSSEQTVTESTTRKDESTQSSSTTGVSDATSSEGESGESTSDSSGGTGENTGECTEEGFFRNPENCGKFYRCVDFNGDGQQFVRYDFDCPEGLVFDEVNSVCNWPEQSPACETKGDGSDGGENTTSGEETSSESSTKQSTDSTEQSSENTSPQSSQATTEQTTQSTNEQSPQTSTQQPTSQGPTTGDSSECSEPGFFRCKDDCSKFYRCVDENGRLVRYDFKCPDGLIFDDQNKKCDWPSSELTCDTDSSTSEGSTDSSRSSTSSETSAETSSETASVSTSESSTLTPTSQPSSTQSQTSSSDTSTSDIECTEEGYFRNPDDCRKYYRCIDEGDGTLKREDFACAEDEVFDEEMRYCNRKDLAPPCDDSKSTSSQPETSSTTVSDRSSSESTTDRTTSQTSTESSTSQTSTESSTTPEKSECTEPGFFRCKDDCTKFYRCVEDSGGSGNLTRYDFHCPDGLIFDTQNKKCDFPSSEITCDNQTGTSSTQSPTSGSQSTTESSVDTSEATSSDRSTTPEATSSSTGSSSVEGCTEEGYFRDPEDCRKYYRCLDEGDGTLTREDFECEEDEVFDEEMRYCNRRDLAPPCNETQSSTTESSGGSTDSSSEQSSTESSTTESSGGSTDSSSEQSSTESSSTTESSGGSTDPSSEQSSTGSSSTTESSGGSTDSSSENTGECQEEGFHRDPNDCGKFYRCVDFRGDGQSFTRYDFDCPEGLVFDETNDVCNWPSSVPSCESSASPGEGGSSTAGDSSSSTGDDSNGSTPSEEPASSISGDESSTTSSGEPASQTSSDSAGTSDSTTPSSNTNDSTGSGSSTTSSGSSESTGGSSNYIECTEEGFFRHPEDCGKFYRCVDFAGTGESFVRYDFDCPEGLVFDEVNSVCNWPNQSPRCETGSGGDNGSENGGSTDGASTDSSTSPGTTVAEQTTPRDNDSTTSEGQTTTSSAPGTDTTPSTSDEFRCKEEGYFKHPSDCKKYYECKRDADTGELVRIDCECPDGHVWDNEGWYCNAEELSPPCGENESSFRCSEEGFFRDPEDCTRYYRCNRTGENEFESERFQCEEGLVFDEEGRYCNSPELSEPCDGSASTSEGGASTTESEDSGTSASSTPGSSTAGSGSSDSTTSDPGASNQCTREGFFRNPEDCTKYYLCRKQENTEEFDRTDYSCDEGRIFDESSNYCNEPELSDEPCDNSSSGGSTTVQQSSTDSPTSSSGPDGTRGNGGDPQCSQAGFFRHPDDCNKFYRCVDFSGSGESFVRYDFDCPEGLHFDEVNSVCNWPTMTPRCESGNQLLRRYLGVIN